MLNRIGRLWFVMMLQWKLKVETQKQQWCGGILVVAFYLRGYVRDIEQHYGNKFKL